MMKSTVGPVWLVKAFSVLWKSRFAALIKTAQLCAMSMYIRQTVPHKSWIAAIRSMSCAASNVSLRHRNHFSRDESFTVSQTGNNHVFCKYSGERDRGCSFQLQNSNMSTNALSKSSFRCRKELLTALRWKVDAVLDTFCFFEDSFKKVFSFLKCQNCLDLNPSLACSLPALLNESLIHSYSSAYSVRNECSCEFSKPKIKAKQCLQQNHFKSPRPTPLVSTSSLPWRRGHKLLQLEGGLRQSLGACRHLHSIKPFSLENADYHAFLRGLVAEQGQLLEAQLRGESIDHNHLHFLGTVTRLFTQLEASYADLAELRSIVSGDYDPEFQALAKSDMDNILKQVHNLESKLVSELVGAEPADENDITLEVSAGVGGQEAMLFTMEMFHMYAGFASFKGWSFEVVNQEVTDGGGLRKASALISGSEVYKQLKFEAGVHRVQRVPKTEKTGRLHTSTMTVAVLPQPSQIDIQIHPKDLHIDTFRASGAGGQHVNTTDSAVRITHKPSGTVVECQQDRSQIKNRDLAMKILLSRLFQKKIQEQEAALRKNRKLQVGSGGRSEKIRTYNFSQDRVTDHRGPITLHNITSFISGRDDLDNLIQSLMLHSRQDILQAMVQQALQSKKLN